MYSSKNTKIIISTVNFVKKNTQCTDTYGINDSWCITSPSIRHFQETVLTYIYHNSSNKRPSSSFQGKKVIKFSLSF